MSGDRRSVAGWVLVGGERAPGRSVRLRLTDGDTARAVSEGCSLPDGQFAVLVPAEEHQDSVLVVDALDAAGDVVARHEAHRGSATVVVLDEVPPDEDGPEPALLTAVAAHLARQVTRLEATGELPPGATGVLDAALGRLGWVGGLLASARDAQLGDDQAAAVLREALGAWSREVPCPALAPEPLRVDPAERQDDPAPAVSVVSVDAVSTLLAGAVAAGRTLQEQADLVDGLGAALSVRTWIDALARATSAGDLPTMQVMMGAPGGIPGLPGGGLPGVPGGGLPGVPGGGLPGLPGGLLGGRPKGPGIVHVHPTVSDIVARFRSPILLGPSARERCLVAAMVEVSRLRASLPAYRITALEPADACPGAVLTIAGRNFGGHGSVVFPGTAAPVPSASALEWTDSRIRVVVPDGAGPGALTLSILEAALIRCDQTWTVFRPGGSDASFEGGTAAVTAFLLDGTADPLRVDPGAQVSVSCDVTPHPLAATQVWVTQDGTTVADFGTLAGGGHRQHDLIAPSPTGPVTCVVHLRVSGPCGSVEHQRTLTVAAMPHLRVAHLEVTQALQDAVHTVRLVAGRTTGVRAYLTSGLTGFSYTGTPGEVSNVTGTLHVERGGVVVTSIPATAPTTVRTGFVDADRWGNASVLVFVVPGGLMAGDVTMRVTAKVAGLPGFGTDTPSTSGARTVHTQPSAVVTVVRLRMGLTNPAHPAAAPSVATWQGSSVGAQDRYPLSDDGMLVRVPTTGDVLSTNHFLGKDDGWEDALDDLDDYADRFNDFNSVFACNVPAGAYSLNGISHAANDRAWPLENDRRCFLSQAGLRATFAHEMAHTLGVGHAPCGKVEGVDGRLPGSTEPGVVGWRPSDGLLMPPMWSELMSYCTPTGATYQDRWPSVALWSILLDELT